MVPKDVSTNPSGAAAPAQPITLQPVADSTPIHPRRAPSPFLTPGNLLMLGVFGVAIAGIYVLSLRNGPSTALADHKLAHAKVEAALSVLDAPPTPGEVKRRSTAKAIVGEFYTAARQRQVSAKDLKGNPFVFQQLNPPAPEPVGPPKAPEPEETVPDEQKQAEAALKKLKLQSVLVGRQTTALISSNLVTTGQTIYGWEVERITPRKVELRWRDLKHTLEMPK